MLFGKHVIISIVAIVISIIAVWFLSREIVLVSDTVVRNRHLADELGKRTELYSVLTHDIAVVGANDTVIENSFIPADNISEFVSALESIALKNGVTQSFHFGTPLNAPVATSLPLSSIEYQNSMPLNIYSFISYLKDFERLPYFTKINSMNITAQGPTGWRGLGNASWGATLYTKTNL